MIFQAKTKDKFFLLNWASDCCTFWPWFLQDKPILRLFLVMGFNGVVSMAVAAIFIELEWPAQQERLENDGTDGTFLTGLLANFFPSVCIVTSC